MDKHILAKSIRKDSRSLKVEIVEGGVRVTPVFQEPVLVQSWIEYREAIKAGRISFPDSETVQ
jgi:hypothetical protein